MWSSLHGLSSWRLSYPLSEKGLADSPIVQSRTLLGEMLHLIATMQVQSRCS
jgi:hypothetical protein